MVLLCGESVFKCEGLQPPLKPSGWQEDEPTRRRNCYEPASQHWNSSARRIRLIGRRMGLILRRIRSIHRGIGSIGRRIGSIECPPNKIDSVFFWTCVSLCSETYSFKENFLFSRRNKTKSEELGRLGMEWFSSSWKRYQCGWKRDVVSVFTDLVIW